MGNETVQPGTEIDAQLWKQFRNDVQDRRGRVNGVLASELENAIREYVEASHGGDTIDRLERIESRLDELVDGDVEGEGSPAPSRDDAKEKNFSESGKDDPSGEVAPVPEADGGVPVNDRHLYDEDEDDDRSAVERRTDAAVSELVLNYDQFTLEDLDEAIEDGADVHSAPSIRDYRKRVFERLGGKDEIVLPATEDKPLESQVFFVDVEDARASRASTAVVDDGETVEDAAAEYDVPAETVRDALTSPQHGAILIRDDGYAIESAAERAGTDPESIREILPDEFLETVEDRDDQEDELEVAERDVDVDEDEVRGLDRAERLEDDPLDDVDNDLRSDEPIGLD